MKNRWIRVTKILVVFFMMILFMNALSLFLNVKRDVSYGSRSYGLDTLNSSFDNGEYYQVYLYTVSNQYADNKPEIDVSQYEAFGRYFHYYTLARMYDDPKYLDLMESEKEKITWKKILNVIDELENDMQ